jgi:hypothetical protein
MSEETKETNEAASTETEQSAESSQTPAETSQADVSSKSDVVDAAKATDKTVEAASDWDAKTSYESLQKNYDQVSKSYNELRREFTRRTQNESDLQKKIDSLTTMINKATETPIDPKQFFNDLQTQGPKAFEPLFSKREAAIREEFEKARMADQEAISTLQFEVGKMTRRADSTNYPDFQQLEPIMADLVADEKVSLDFSQGAGAVLDTLYKLARSLNADKAVQDARALGKKEADAQSAKEANAKIAGGGKTGAVTTDPSKMSLEEHRNMLISQLGVADENGQ